MQRYRKEVGVMKRIIGAVMVVSVLAILFGVTAHSMGAREALAGWGLAILLTAVITIGVALFAGEL